MKNSLSKLFFSASLAGSVLLAGSGVSADSDDLMPNELAKADYVNYCAACHGVGGTGNGPMVSELKGKPSDLTLLSKNNGGNFPYLKLRKIVDGSYNEGNLRAHSSGEMPIWGDAFRRHPGAGYVDAQVRIMNILDYISLIQYE